MTKADHSPLSGRHLMAVFGAGAALGVAALSAHTPSLPETWSAAGLYLLVYILSPRTWRPVLSGVLGVGLFLALGGLGVGWVEAGITGVLLALVPYLVALVLDRAAVTRLTELRSLGLFVISALGAAALVALTSGVFDLLVGHALGGGVIPNAVNTFASLALLGPIGLTEHRRLLDINPLEFTLQAVLLLGGMLAAYFWASDNLVQLAPISLLMWASFRFGERILAMELAVIFLGALVLSWVVSLPTGEPQWYVDIFLIIVFFVAMPSALAGRERDDAMRDLRLSERTFRNNYRHSQVPLALVEWSGERLQFIDINPAGARLFRAPLRTLAGTDVHDTLDLPANFNTIVKEIEDGSRPGWEGRARLQGPQLSELLLIVSLLETRSGRARLSLTLQDVTSEYRIHQQLTAERNYSAAVLDSSPCIILVTTADGIIVNINSAGCEAVGFAEEELIGRGYYDVLVPPELSETVKRDFSLDRPYIESGEALVSTKSGRRRVVEWRQSTFSSNLHDKPLRVFTALDVTEQRQQSQFLKQLVNSASTVAFIGTDLNGQVTMFNSGAETLLGHTRAKATGMNFVSFLSPAALSAHAGGGREGEFADLVAHVARERIPETRDWTWVRASGASLRVSMTTSVVTDYAGRPFGYLFVARDVSDTRRSQEIVVLALKRERDAVNRLRALDRVKDDFISTVSHELRTPMTSILGTTEMLEDGDIGDLTKAQRERLNVISRNGERLLGLADDLLLAAKLQSGTEQPLEETLDLRPIIEECFDSLASRLGGRRLDIAHTLPDSPVLVVGNSHHLERAVTNLLSNAIKFTPDGGRVRCTLGVDPSGVEAVLTVSDTGLGIPNEALNNVFERFYRAPNVDDLAIQGTGLGLSIVKQIVDNLRGQLTISSTLGSGTTVTVALPQASRRVPSQTTRN